MTWNIIGIVDFIGAMIAGPTTIPGFFSQAIEQPYAMNYFILIPIFAVPIYFITHVFSLYKLFTERGDEQVLTPAMAQ